MLGGQTQVLVTLMKAKHRALGGGAPWVEPEGEGFWEEVCLVSG